MQLGRKIRDLRLRHGLTVQQLAEASHLSKGFISQVENGRTSPSLATLHDLALALHTSAAYLVVEEHERLHVVRVAERPQIPAHGGPARVQVLSAVPKRNLELLLIELPPGSGSATVRHCHHAEECALCLEGRARFVQGAEEVVLETGDSCHYDGRVTHTFQNAGERETRVLIALTPAVFESAFQIAARDALRARPAPAPASA
ncbi:MAG TPA: XRE family transcriptional regulator [Terriglobales bacterium]|nr:XRE family transcriptional regulator [Terriglobales bacterium]